MENGHLSLTRRPFEELVFQIEDSSGQNIEVTQVISRISGEQVRISIDAPKSVKILRGELID